MQYIRRNNKPNDIVSPNTTKICSKRTRIPRELIRSVLGSHVNSFGASLNTTCTYSKTELRAAHPNLHGGRLRPLLQVAARICDLAS